MSSITDGFEEVVGSVLPFIYRMVSTYIHGPCHVTTAMEPMVIDIVEWEVRYPVHGTITSMEEILFETVSAAVHADG